MIWFAIFFSSIFIISTEACDCVKTTAEESFKKGDAVFEGEVLEIQEWKEKNEVGQAILFEVKKNWKGADSSQVIVYTSGGTCAFPFSKGENYLVFSSQRWEEKQLYTSSCSRTKQVDQAEGDISILNQFAKGVTPTKQVDLKVNRHNRSNINSVVMVSSIGASLLIIVLSMFLIRRMRKK